MRANRWAIVAVLLGGAAGALVLGRGVRPSPKSPKEEPPDPRPQASPGLEAARLAARNLDSASSRRPSPPDRRTRGSARREADAAPLFASETPIAAAEGPGEIECEPVEALSPAARGLLHKVTSAEETAPWEWGPPTEADPHHVRIRVVDDLGAPVEGAVVRMRQTDLEGAANSRSRDAETGVSGSLEVMRRPRSEYFVSLVRVPPKYVLAICDPRCRVACTEAGVVIRATEVASRDLVFVAFRASSIVMSCPEVDLTQVRSVRASIRGDDGSWRRYRGPLQWKPVSETRLRVEGLPAGPIALVASVWHRGVLRGETRTVPGEESLSTATFEPATSSLAIPLRSGKGEAATDQGPAGNWHHVTVLPCWGGRDAPDQISVPRPESGRETLVIDGLWVGPSVVVFDAGSRSVDVGVRVGLRAGNNVLPLLTLPEYGERLPLHLEGPSESTLAGSEPRFLIAEMNEGETGTCLLSRQCPSFIEVPWPQVVVTAWLESGSERFGAPTLVRTLDLKRDIPVLRFWK